MSEDLYCVRRTRCKGDWGEFSRWGLGFDGYGDPVYNINFRISITADDGGVAQW